MMLRRLLNRVVPSVAWRLECPRTAEAVVDDFIHNHLGAGGVQYLRALPPSMKDDLNATLAFRRRITAVYGIATSYEDPSGQRGRPGWNRALLAECRTCDAEAATDVVFKRLWERVRDEPS